MNLLRAIWRWFVGVALPAFVCCNTCQYKTSCTMVRKCWNDSPTPKPEEKKTP